MLNRAPPPQPPIPPSTYTFSRFQPFIDNCQCCHVDTKPPPTTHVHIPSPSVTFDQEPQQIRTRTFTSNTHPQHDWEQQKRMFLPQRTQPWEQAYQHQPQRRKPVVRYDFLMYRGIPTHCLSLISFMNKRMCRFPVSIFMVSLSLVNIIILGGPVIMQWLNHRLLIGFVVTDRRFVCGLHVYIDIVGSSINSWLILVIAVEHYLSVVKPLLIRKRFKREHAYIIIFIIVLLAALVPIIFLIIGYHIPKCLLVYPRTYQIIGSIEICIVYVIPSMLIFIFSVITIHKLRYRLKNHLGRRIRISILLIIVSLSFTAFTLPFQIHWFISIVQRSMRTNFRLNLFNISFRYLTLTIRN
ncbi:unnamed protein product [Didymodactylos carnosus]|uniref:G-protein coupled receptors family 1 profile domain-containing protein n=1 Tax=Didymodactylos carnosus TaxID=1234261 RepID=A0A815FRP3_9BILA|nr:unnamed protein product [Didymodactylos carnosus]CAF4183369.1 unnamed protein product [Didymodactylos carnosus]